MKSSGLEEVSMKAYLESTVLLVSLVACSFRRRRHLTGS